MPRKKQNGADDDAPPPAGDNGPTSERVLMDLTALTELMNTSMRHKTKFKVLYEQHEGAGGDRKRLKKQHDLHQLTPAEARSELQADLAYSRLTGLISYDAAGQASFTEALVEPTRPLNGAAAEAGRRLAVARAYGDGYNTAKVGGAADAWYNYLNAGCEEQVSWSRGYEDYFEDNPAAREEQEGAENEEAVEPAAKRKRGRPKKAAATRDPAEPPAAHMDEAPPWSREHLSGDVAVLETVGNV